LLRYFSKDILGIKSFCNNKNRKFLKKYIKIDNPLKVLSNRIRKDYSAGGDPLMYPVIQILNKLRLPGYPKFRKLFFAVTLLMVGFSAVAPESDTLFVSNSPGIQPFSALMYATAMVETMGNPLFYNEFENAVGIFQIRQVRVDEYNRRTGSNYTLADMADVKLSEKVFLYFASKYKPHEFERIAKAWNGSGPMTELYWKRIKEYL
jgi:hypothetical protein